jgi:Cu+-exporting ATPase
VIRLKEKDKMNRTEAQLVVDPVCKMELPADEAAATLKFNSQTYYFCHPACLHLFEADPLPYVRDALADAAADAVEK